MSETTDLVAAPQSAGTDEASAASGTTGRTRRRGSGLSGMLLPELQRLAAELGISGTGRMRKGDLVAAISARQVGGEGAGNAPAAPAEGRTPTGTPTARAASTDSTQGADAARGVAATAAPLEAPVSGGANGGPVTAPAAAPETPAEAAPRRRRAASRPAGAPAVDGGAASPAAPATDSPAPAAAVPAAEPRTEAPAAEPRTEPPAADSTTAPEKADGDRVDGERPQRSRDRGERGNRTRGDRDGNRESGNRDGGDRAERGARDNRESGNRDGGDRAERGNRENRDGRDGTRDGNRGPDRNERNDRGGRPENRNDTRNDRGGNDRNDEDDDDFEGGRGRRGRRYRDRNRRGTTGRERFDQGEPTVSEDDVLLPVAGILDVLDNYAFVRTSGYLTGPNDVYVSLSQVRRYGLRRGDAITGAVRQPREGERKDKYNALVRLDTVNGLDPEQARQRPEFTKLTPLYPQERLRLETEPHQLTTRVIDLVMPIGKGQRALIVSPPKAGKTMVLQAIANAITTNNPECHLMVVLVDERPEEVTDMQRSVKGEVIASTFDRPPSDHTTVAELSIERAKRLVEMGHDVVVLLDSITRLGRAYNLAAPASGRILSGGVDSTALYPPKRFLGAARNIENGGSLTIIASALVETGSTMDTVIFEEFKGTGNAEIKLDRRLADKRVFPAVDVNASGTRKEEILMSPDELAIVIKLRRVLAALEPQQALELLLDKLKKTRNNIEFLMQIQKTTLGPGND
ncbi:transcription termination factor Rho [Geodermatophilus sabuli]|uniref:Transcription termination factor Rho n=2 Tax=Geodermatophilus sabuli TaxID=1564158 RepID=A0A285EGP1_9ACTN|nr:transcription termination factor Rho [Geodermatophilus sabuli]MBB3085947.1 transcription termination factor Rho [Geodermatophilus sabuli]SNX98288.1 transcription termination factor Rho [Geodermatophilus sabuli]